MSTTTKKRGRKKLDLDDFGITPEEAERFKAMAAIPEAVVTEFGAKCELEREEFTTEGLADFARRRRGPGAPPEVIEFVHALSRGESPTIKIAGGVATYRTSPIKRKRRTKADIQAIRNAVMEFVEVENPATVRQVFYHLTTRGLIEKSENEYKATVCRILADMRRDGQLPYDWIADNTRWMRKPRTYGSLQSMLEYSQQTYRRAIWDEQDAYVEVWLEKEALAGVLVDVTSAWDVPLMVTRGYPSISFLHSAGEVIAAEDRPTYLYYFGDHDPSGVDIDRFVEKELRGHAPECDLHFNRVAILDHQIRDLKLPSRPTKKSDSRSTGFKGRSVEVDAIPPNTLRTMCENCITQHIDQDQLQRTRNVEEAERETLLRIATDVA